MSRRTQVEKYAARIVAALRTYSVDRLSVRSFKRIAGLNRVPKATFWRARNLALQTLQGEWEARGQWLIRIR